MQRCLVTSILLTILLVSVACQPAQPTNTAESTSVEPTPFATAETAATQKPTEPPPTPIPTATASIVHSASERESPPSEIVDTTPKSVLPDGWKVVGSRQQGVQLGIPNAWVNLSGLLDEPDLINQFGDNVRFFAASSKETGTALASGQLAANGGFVIAFSRNGSIADPVESLHTLLRETGSTIEEPSAITIGDKPAAFIDITGDPLNLIVSETASIHMRLILVPIAHSAEQILFAFGTSSNNATALTPIFDNIEQTVEVFQSPNSIIPSEPVTILDTLAHGDVAQAALASNSSDYYAIPVESGQFITLILNPIDPIDLTLSLLDPAGRTVQFSDQGYASNYEFMSDILVPLSGTYFIKIDEFFNQGGVYNLTVLISNTPLYEGGGPIGMGQEVSGTLYGNEQHAWTFSATAGQVISIVLSPDSQQLDMTLRLLDAEGNRIIDLDEGYSGDAEVVADFELEVSSDYIIIVKDFSGRGGDYTLALDEGAATIGNFYDAGDLLSGNVYQELLQEREAHTWFYDGFAGDQINIIVSPLNGNVDLEVWLLSPDFERLIMQDATLAGELETIQYTLEEDGQFVLLVQDYFGEPGGYQLSFLLVGNDLLDVAGNVYYGDSVTDSLALGKAMLWYLDAEEDDIITLRLNALSNEADFVVIIKDPAGNIVATIDNNGTGANESLEEFTLDQEGEWTIIVREFLGAGGDFELFIERQ